ncbi:MAG: alpha-xylosidase [Gammaproteobacteria bacterium]|nr:alpha-xylosidase [Gammaproteobacteria bacterium]
MELNKKLIMKLSPKAKDENIILFKDYRFTVLTNNVIRIEKGSFLDEATISIINRDTKIVNFKYEIKNDLIIISTKEVTLYFDTSKDVSLNYVIFNKDKTQEKRYLNNDSNLKGTMRTLDTFFNEGFCVDRSITEFRIDTLPLENGIISKNGIALIDDKISPVLGIDGLPHERVDTELDLYLFMFLNEPYKALNDFYLLTGKTPLVPRFALGNWWSRYHRYTQNEYLSVLDRFSKEGVPLSIATIDMDWHYVDIVKDFHLKELGLTDPKYGSLDGWTGYSFDTKLWPNYKEAFKDIKNRGIYITLNLHPRDGIRHFEDMYPIMAKAMGKDPSLKEVIEFDFTDSNYINNYFKYVMHPYEDDGVDFWWIDYQQDRVTKIKNLDPLWALNHYHYLDNKSHLTLSRYAGLGSHRYPLGFSGDTKMTWDFLDFMPYFTFTASNAGYTWWSHDIGAHHYGIKDDDLYLRWIEFGVFSPINRIHGNIMDVLSKEPWLNKSSVRFITDYYLRLRHRLIPYIYHYSHLTSEKGIPLIRPIYYDNPKDERSYKDEHTYYFGETVVSPITSKSRDGYAIKDMFLPKGKYYDYITRRFYKGGRNIKLVRDIGEIPFLIKEGSILPLENDIDNFTTYPKSLELNFIGRNAKLSLNESDDNKLITNISLKEEDNSLVVYIESDTDLSFNRDYNLEFRSFKDAKIKVYVDGNEVPFKYERAFNIGLTIKNVSIKSKIKVVLSDLEEDTFKSYLDEYSLYILTGENGVNEDKQKIYEHIKNNVHTVKEYRDYLKNLKVNKNLKLRLYELSYFE